MKTLGKILVKYCKENRIPYPDYVYAEMAIKVAESYHAAQLGAGKDMNEVVILNAKQPIIEWP